MEFTESVITRLPGNKRTAKSRPRREVLYKRISVDHKSCWTVFPVKLPSVTCLNETLSVPSYKYWKRSQKINLDKCKTASYSTKRVVEIEVSPMRQVSAIMRRLGTFDLLGPQSTSTELRSSSYMSPEQSRRKPKDVSLSVQTLSIVSTAPNDGLRKLPVKPLHTASVDNKDIKRINTEERSLHQFIPNIALLSDRTGGTKVKTVQIMEPQIQSERSHLRINTANGNIEKKIPKGVTRTESGKHFSLTHFNRISVFDNDVSNIK